MMKKFKQFIAFVLALCMLFSLSVAAFAAEPEMFGPDDLHRPPFGQTGPDAVGAGPCHPSGISRNP